MLNLAPRARCSAWSSDSIMVDCPICSKPVKQASINAHIDSGCSSHIDSPPASQQNGSSQQPVASIFAKKQAPSPALDRDRNAPPNGATHTTPKPVAETALNANGKRTSSPPPDREPNTPSEPLPKRQKPNPPPPPLAERMRPATLADVHGQPHLVGPEGLLTNLLAAASRTRALPSLILWGPAGTGKTTIARALARAADARCVEINSTASGVAECKKLFADARGERALTGRGTLLFCDEVHRFSRVQQDVFLGPVERGDVALLGATTENPSFKVQGALLSRCRVLSLRPLGAEDLRAILRRALQAERSTAAATHQSEAIDDALLGFIAEIADGDARTALNLLELALSLAAPSSGTSSTDIRAALTRTAVYDRAGDARYDCISSLHKSIRGSDAHAALYYLARMLAAGEDPLYVARRLVVVASEDVGLADNGLLPLATAAHAACERLGMPECRINLAHATVALALAPKSTRAYRGLANAMRAVEAEPGVGSLPVPVHLRNAPTRLMREMGYGKEYKYNPEYLNGAVQQDYLPEGLIGREFLEELDLGTRVDEDLAGSNR